MTNKAKDIELIISNILGQSIPDFNYKIVKDITKILTDKFHIISKTDYPKKWVEECLEKEITKIGRQEYIRFIPKLKWRERSEP